MGSPRKADKLLQDALTNSDFAIIETILKSADINPDTKDVNHGLQTPLMRACHVGASSKQLLTIVQLLLGRKPQINAQDASGKTALSHACIAELCSVIKLLVEYPGCDPNLQDCDGNSPLTFACRTGREGVLKCFLTCCQDRNLLLDFHRVNNRGLTCLAEAEKRNLKHMVEKFIADYNIFNDTSTSPHPPLHKRPSDIFTMTSPRLNLRDSGRLKSRDSGISVSSSGSEHSHSPVPIRKRYCQNLTSSAGSTSPNILHANVAPRDQDVTQSRDSFVETMRGSDDFSEASDDDEISEELDDLRRLRYKNSRRGSISLPDLRNIPVIPRDHSVPDIVITPSTSIEVINATESIQRLSLDCKTPSSREKLRTQTRDMGCSLPNLLAPRTPTRKPYQRHEFTPLREDKTIKLSLPDLPRSGKAKRIGFNK